MHDPATEVDTQVKMSRVARMSMEERMDNMERNLDLCLNYVRHLAQLWLSVEKIRDIEAELADGE